MINVFEVAANDQSIYYLGQIFGNVGGSLGAGQGVVVLAGTGPGLMGAMFKVFNTGLLVLGALIVAYTTIVGVLKTATEGEFLGKWHSLWVPLRTVIGIAGLMPTNTGYCLMQMLVMWVIIQGIGAADAVWGAAVDYLGKGGATQVTVDRYSDMGPRQDIKYLFQALVCQAAAKSKTDSGNFCNQNPNDGFCQRSDSDMLNIYGPQTTPVNDTNPVPLYNMGPNGACGVLPLGNEQQLGMDGVIAKARNQSYQAIVPTLGQIARSFVQFDRDYEAAANADVVAISSGLLPPPKTASWLLAYCSDNNISSGACWGQQLPSYPGISSVSSINTLMSKIYWPYAVYPYVGGNFLQSSVDLYLGYVGNALSNSQNSAAVMSAVQTIDTTKLLQESKANGWITAGGYYYAIANLSNKTQSDVNKSYMSAPTAQSTYSQISPFANNKEIGNRMDWLNAAQSGLIQAVEDAQAKGNQGVTSGTSCAFVGFPGLSGLCTMFIQGFISALSSGNANPIISLQIFGEALLITISIVFVGLMVFIFATIGPAQSMSSVQGFGYALSEVYTYLLLPILFFMGALFIFAGMLAVYLPMIPYIIFTFGAIGWFIATIEAMVAAPIVAIGIMHPEGEHEVWGKSAKAVMILLNIFLRPTLMIFGMMAGMLLSYVVVKFINAAFVGVITQINPLPGPIEIILFMFIYTSLLMTALNKTFSLIHLIPDNVMRWIGEAGMQFGEEQSLGEIRKGAEGGVGAAKGAMEGAGRSMKERQEAVQKKGEADRAARAAGGEGLQVGGGQGGGAKAQPTPKGKS